MESHGVKGKIHVSMATAKELMKHGNSKILVEREALIHAKGKGYLQTYFLTDRFIHAGASRKGSMGTESSETNSSLSGSNESGSAIATSTAVTSSRRSSSMTGEESTSLGGYDDLPYAAQTLDASMAIDEASCLWT